MPVLDGFDVLFALKREELPAAIIFVTAYDRYAVRAFEVNAIDYLMKPYTKDRFAVTLERARTRLASPPSESRDGFEVLLRSLASRAAAPERIAVRLKDSVQFVRTSDIDWLQADGNYTKLHVGASAIRTRETLSELETKLSPAGFVRIHRSIVLNVDRIVRLEPWTHGEYVIVLRNGTKLNSSRAYGEELRRLLD
jgi:two-component system LytT family response regulator